ncbi:MAG: hypothetical protein E4G90_06775 [Gemmatimonadales bacterium]|nr:MAG: hypothetical protein E4G90_06775 [Gemmatimonadales bacterium]
MTKRRDEPQTPWGDESPEVNLPATIRAVAQDYHRPPATPREEMWARIVAARGSRPQERDAEQDIIPSRRRPHQRWVVLWAAGIAATLIVGIGLGRLSISPGDDQPILTSIPMASATPNIALAVSAAQHFSRTETLLTMLRTDPTWTEEFGIEARDLLTSTRLMIDAPAIHDPELRTLLIDLELILVQIVQLDENLRQEELDLITDGLDQRQVLPRIRTAIPAGPIAT